MKKIPTVFVRDFDHDHGRYVTEQVTPGCEWVLAGEGVATRKWDGTCIMIDDGPHYLWARREVKTFPPPPGFQEVDRDPITGNRVGWEPASQSSYAKILAEMRADIEGLRSGTYELVGPKVNGNPENFGYHTLLPHGSNTIGLASIGRDFHALRSWTADHPGIEGIVFWRQVGNSDAGMAKIKRRDFPAAGRPTT